MPQLVIVLLGVGGLMPLSACSSISQLHRYFFSSCPARGPEPSAEFDIKIPAFDLNEYYATLRSFNTSFELREIAQIRDHQTAYPIYQVRHFGPSARRTILVVAGIHGNEAAGVLAIPRLLQRIATEPSRYTGWNIIMVTPANPVGLVHGSRYNSSGCDINRDFGPFQTPEASLVQRVIAESRPDAIASLHEGPQEGFFVIATSEASPAVGEEITQAVAVGGIVLARRSFLGLPLGTPGLSAEGVVGSFVKRAIRLNSLGAYANGLGIGTYTTETPWSSADFESRIQAHVLAVEAILASDRAA